MKLVEGTIYAVISFTALYILVVVGLRVFEVVETYTAHMISGVIGTIVGVGVFLLVLIKKK